MFQLAFLDLNLNWIYETYIFWLSSPNNACIAKTISPVTTTVRSSAVTVFINLSACTSPDRLPSACNYWSRCWLSPLMCLDVNSSLPKQNGRHFTEDNYKCIFVNEKFCISIQISLKFVPLCPIGNKAALVHVMALHQTGDKPLPEVMLARFSDAYERH